MGKIRDRGASLVEYALLAALVALVCVAALTQLDKGASKAMWARCEPVHEPGVCVLK